MPEINYVSIIQNPTNTFLKEVSTVHNIFPHPWCVTYFFDLQKIFFNKFLVDTTFTYKFFGLLKTSHPSLARLAALTFWNFLIPTPPLHLGLQTLSKKPGAMGMIVAWVHVTLLEKIPVFLIHFFAMKFGILIPCMVNWGIPTKLDLMRTYLPSWERNMAFQPTSFWFILSLMLSKSFLVFYSQYSCNQNNSPAS